MCTPDQCVSKDKMCDGKVDCLNGRDESVDLCLTECMDTEYQCANGICIKKDLVCDNKYDCIDGSDELENTCGGNDKWIRKLPVKCHEPLENGLQFSADTKFYKPINKTKYVYANMPVRFECHDSTANLTGDEWNVCMVTGNWRHDPPRCIVKWVNPDPDTNGTNGCKIDTYNKYKDQLTIYKCTDDGKDCSTPVTPPIDNIEVRFECNNDYHLNPIKNTSKFMCRNGKWDNYSNFRDPKCVSK